MSSCNWSETCPKCNDPDETLWCYTDSHSPECNYTECLSCGYYTRVKEGRMSLKDINELRENAELPKLKKRRKQDD